MLCVVDCLFAVCLCYTLEGLVPGYISSGMGLDSMCCHDYRDVHFRAADDIGDVNVVSFVGF